MAPAPITRGGETAAMFIDTAPEDAAPGRSRTTTGSSAKRGSSCPTTRRRSRPTRRRGRLERPEQDGARGHGPPTVRDRDDRRGDGAEVHVLRGRALDIPARRVRRRGHDAGHRRRPQRRGARPAGPRGVRVRGEAGGGRSRGRTGGRRQAAGGRPVGRRRRGRRVRGRGPLVLHPRARRPRRAARRADRQESRRPSPTR